MDATIVQGYDRRAVDAYLVQVEAERDRLQGELEAANRRVAAARVQLAEAEEGQRALGRMLLDAQREVEERRRHGAEAVQAMLHAAEVEALRILAEAGLAPAALTGPDQPGLDPVPVAADHRPPPVESPGSDARGGSAHNGSARDGAADDSLDDDDRDAGGVAADLRARVQKRRRARVRRDPFRDEEHEPSHEAYLANLRAALLDDAPLGPRLGAL